MERAAPPDHVREILDLEFGHRITHLDPVSSGQISDSWYVTADGGEYVLRVSRPSLKDTLHKDYYAVRELAPTSVPLPEFVTVKDWRDRSYAITTRSPGVTLDTISGDAYRKLLPDLMATLDAIHGSDIAATSGWGDFDSRGRGSASSWPQFLQSVAQQTEADSGFYGDWHRLFEESFLERTLFDSVFALMPPLLEYCPGERYLVHADYGFDNVLVANGRITAVLDWANAMFGDFLFDVAWLDFCHAEVDYADRFEQFYRERGREPDHYRERLRCYYCYIALDSLRFYAQTDQPSGYDWVKGRIESVLR